MASEKPFVEVLENSISQLRDVRKRYRDASSLGPISEDLLAELSDRTLSAALDLQLVILDEEGKQIDH